MPPSVLPKLHIGGNEDKIDLDCSSVQEGGAFISTYWMLFLYDSLLSTIAPHMTSLTHSSPPPTHHLHPLITSTHSSPPPTHHLHPLITSTHSSPPPTHHLNPLITSIHSSPLPTYSSPIFHPPSPSPHHIHLSHSPSINPLNHHLPTSFLPAGTEVKQQRSQDANRGGDCQLDVCRFPKVYGPHDLRQPGVVCPTPNRDRHGDALVHHGTFHICWCGRDGAIDPREHLCSCTY